jgi:GxxExxY protein
VEIDFRTPVAKHQPLPASLNHLSGRVIGCAIEVLAEGELVVEVKSVQHLEHVFVSQVLTYLKATDRRLGLILNFSCPTLRSGIRRVVR